MCALRNHIHKSRNILGLLTFDVADSSSSFLMSKFVHIFLHNYIALLIDNVFRKSGFNMLQISTKVSQILTL